MKYMSTSEAAAKWNLSKRRVIVLCNEGRIDGAQKAGSNWIIPETEKNREMHVLKAVNILRLLMKHEVKQMIYVCDACRFLFKRVGEPEQCPDCGKYSIRAANEEEIAEFLSRRPEEEMPAMNVKNEY